MKTLFKVLSVVTVLASVNVAVAKDKLLLGEYLGQVRAKNGALTSALGAASGSAKRAEEGDLLLAPTLVGEAEFINDKRPTSNPAFQGYKTERNFYSLGISQLTPVGLTAKVSYDIDYIKLSGVNTAFVPLPEYYDARPTLTLTQSFWRDGFGAETRATLEALEAQALATSYNESYRAKLELSEAELAYWRLAITRDAVRVQRESLERSKKILEWSERRLKLELADKSDFLQAQAAYELRQLDLQAAHDDDRSARRAFNLSRGLDSEEVSEQLASLENIDAATLSLPKRAKLRDDVRAAEQARRATIANTERRLSHLNPLVDVYGSYSFNGHRSERADAISDSFKDDSPMWTVGLRLEVPLNPWLLFRTREGYHVERQAAEDNYDRKLLEQESQWKDLSEKLTEAKRRLMLSRSLEKAQDAKLAHEKKRHSLGRTTTYQVLLFEQDFAAAQLARLRTQADVVRLVAQMKTFRSDI